MARNLPPPIALRAFEAAARNLSFTRAAEELNVTQAAISHQVRVLESHFGVPLFVRLTRRLRLTGDGQALYSAAHEAFDRLEETSQQIRGGLADSVLTVSLTPYFSARWLTPRLSRFWTTCPAIDLRLHHSATPGKLDSEEVDLAIGWEMDVASDSDTRPLLSANVVPVCSPELVANKRPIGEIDDLYHYTLLHENDYRLWTMWLESAGVDRVNLKRGTTMDDANVVLQAAIDGQGIALSADVLIMDEIESGRLVFPLGHRHSLGYSYSIACRPGSWKRPKVQLFYDWLLGEVGQPPAADRPADR